MFSIPNISVPAMAHVPPPLLLLGLLGASLVLIFAGRALAKVVAFLAVGLVGAAFGGAIAVQYLPPAWSVLGVLLGFLVGGLLGVALLVLGIGLVVGYAGYLLALDLGLGPTMALVLAVAAFVIGLVLSERILSVATAFAGGLLLFNVLTLYGFGLTSATLVSAALALMGLWVQLASDNKPTHLSRRDMGGQPGDHS